MEECPRCGGKDIAGPHRLDNSLTVDLSYVFLRLPQKTASLLAYTCAECGYTDIYSDEKGLENIRRYGRLRLSKEEIRKGHCQFCGAELNEDMSICVSCKTPVEW